jgi:hypothetical protein
MADRFADIKTSMVGEIAAANESGPPAGGPLAPAPCRSYFFFVVVVVVVVDVVVGAAAGRVTRQRPRPCVAA